MWWLDEMPFAHEPGFKTPLSKPVNYSQLDVTIMLDEIAYVKMYTCLV